MLTRFSVMLVFYALLVFVMYGLFFPVYSYELEVWSAAPKGLNFLALSTQQRGNVAYFALFFILQLFTYIAIIVLPHTMRVSRPNLLQNLAPVTGFHVCLGHAHTGGGSFPESLSNALLAGGVSVWTPRHHLHNGASRDAQTYAAARGACFQVGRHFSRNLLTIPAARKMWDVMIFKTVDCMFSIVCPGRDCDTALSVLPARLSARARRTRQATAPQYLPGGRQHGLGQGRGRASPS